MDAVRKRQWKARVETARDLESLVAEYGDDVVEFSLQPSLPVVLTTPFLRQQVHRTPGAPVSFDTTYDISSDGLKLSLFVVSALSLEKRFVPFLACIHRRLDADAYRRIFLRFFSMFGLFGSLPASFSGVTVDFASGAGTSRRGPSTPATPTPAPTLCARRSWRRRTRGFACASSTSLRASSRSCARARRRARCIELAKKLLSVASEHGFGAAAFRRAQQALFDALAGVDGYGDWHRWWLQADDGAHRTLLLDVGPGTVRRLLLDTTSASESQHRVFRATRSIPEGGSRPQAQAGDRRRGVDVDKSNDFDVPEPRTTAGGASFSFLATFAPTSRSDPS